MPSPSIHLEDVATYPLPGQSFPTKAGFAPDNRRVTFLYSAQGSLVRQLFVFDPDSGEKRLLIEPPGGGATEENLSLEEKLRRERQRQLDLGITDYAWAPAGERILLPFPDGLYVWEGNDLHQLVSSEAGPVLDPRFSPDGNWIAYVQGEELHVIPAQGGNPVQLTTGARGSGRTHGLAEYIAQEEMGRSQGYWWSRDSSMLAYTEVDETHIPVYRIVHQGKDQVGEGAQEDHRYPFAGQSNAVVRLFVVERAGGQPVQMNLGQNADIYLARVAWLPDGRLVAQVENREQTRLDLLAFDPPTGQPTCLLTETSAVWINLHDLFKPLQSGGFLWASERSGYRHLERYDEQGRKVGDLTSGAWMVDALAGVDESAGLVYFTASRETPLESHLYVVDLEGDQPRRITTAPGMHAVTLDRTCRRFVDVHDSITQPPRVTLRALVDQEEFAAGEEIAVIHESGDARIDQLDLHPPEMVTLSNRGGETLYGAVYRPPADEFGPGPYPTLVSVYGGPHAQMVTSGWKMTANMRAQYLARQGFLVFVLDNRGSARRGLQFEGALKHRMGTVEVEDQVDGVRWLVRQGLADPQKVGIYGWSYGGYMAAMSLFRAPETFKAAVAGAPVTHWDGYDTFYTERYMGTPQLNPEGYQDGAVMSHANKPSGSLLIVHGLIDENVHFRHTARLINALIQARKTYGLLLFPDERHAPRKLADRVFMEEQIRDFFVRELMG